MPKALHIAIITIIIVVIIFTALMLILKYDEKGESNMPFNVSKISIISTADAEDLKDTKNTWNKSVGEDNDIYIYISKNENYQKKEIIEKIILNDFNIVERPQKGELFIYKPSENEKLIFENKNEYKSDEIIFKGEQSTNLKKMQISNQGGMIAFRISNQNIGRFVSNEKEIKHNDLLNKINITEESIKAKVTFNLSIVLTGGRIFKAPVTINLPAEDTIETGQSSKELTDLKLVFKRIEN